MNVKGILIEGRDGQEYLSTRYPDGRSVDTGAPLPSEFRAGGLAMIQRMLHLLALVSMLAVVLATWVPGSALAQAPGKRGGTLVLARQGEATNLDPHKVPAFTSHRVFELVYSTLTG